MPKKGVNKGGIRKSAKMSEEKDKGEVRTEDSGVCNPKPVEIQIGDEAADGSHLELIDLSMDVDVTENDTVNLEQTIQNTERPQSSSRTNPFSKAPLKQLKTLDPRPSKHKTKIHFDESPFLRNFLDPEVNQKEFAEMRTAYRILLKNKKESKKRIASNIDDSEMDADAGENSSEIVVEDGTVPAPDPDSAMTEENNLPEQLT